MPPAPRARTSLPSSIAATIPRSLRSAAAESCLRANRPRMRTGLSRKTSLASRNMLNVYRSQARFEKREPISCRTFHSVRPPLGVQPSPIGVWRCSTDGKITGSAIPIRYRSDAWRWFARRGSPLVLAGKRPSTAFRRAGWMRSFSESTGWKEAPNYRRRQEHPAVDSESGESDRNRRRTSPILAEQVVVAFADDPGASAAGCSNRFRWGLGHRSTESIHYSSISYCTFK